MMDSNDSPNVDNNLDTGKTRITSLCHIFTQMAVYGKEICFLLVLLVTLIAALQNSPVKTRKASPPQPFFSESSLVTDLYTGDLESLHSQLRDHELAVVMYYASWDAESMHARAAFDAAARFHFSEQVWFGAINCWWPDGQCYRVFTIYSYPVILAHVSGRGYVRYSGPLVATYLINFISHLLSPLVPLHSPASDLLDLQAQHEAVAVGFVEWSKHQEAYEQLYLMSLRALNHDPSRRVAFAVVTSRTAASSLKVSHMPSLYLYLWNRSMRYPGSKMAYREMTDWIFNNLETVSQWLTPPGIKSTLLAEVVRTPTLFLFTPRHLLLPITPYYNVLRDVALEYYNCNKSSGAKSIQHRGALRKYTLQQEVSRLGDKCLRWSCPNSCCQSVAPPPSASLCTCSACLCLNGTTPELCRHTLSRAMPSLHLSPLQLCDRLPVSYPLHYAHFGHVLVTCKPGDSRHAPSPDDRVQRLQEREQKKPCKVLRQSMEYSEVRFPQPSSPPGSDGLAGLRCRTNRTLQFIAMDTVQFSAFAERLGINVWRAPHHTAAAIVESQEESQFILDGPVTRKSLVEFVTNYTLHGLSRHLRSSPWTSTQGCPADQTCVLDLSSSDFTDTVLDPSLDVVLLYYTPWCGFCKAIFHVFSTVASQFEDIPGILFAKINGEENDLPWQYTVPKYPTISFFPAHRKSESVEFPQDLPVATSNLLQFVLANVRPQVRWQVGLRLCSSACLARNRATLGRRLRSAWRTHHRHTQRRGSPRLGQLVRSIRAELSRLRRLQKLLSVSPTLSPRTWGQLLSPGQRLPPRDEL